MQHIKLLKLPSRLKPLFWSHNFDSLDLNKNKKLIIVQIINYGSWEDWRWLVKIYGKTEIKKTIEHSTATEFRKQALHLAATLLTIPENKLSYAQRGAN